MDQPKSYTSKGGTELSTLFRAMTIAETKMHSKRAGKDWDDMFPTHPNHRIALHTIHKVSLRKQAAQSDKCVSGTT